MQHALVEHGFITTHLHLQPQDLTSGTLRIEITPGRIHSLKHGPASNRRAKLRSIMPTTPGALLNLRDVEHGLENLRRLPSVDAKIAIEAAHDSNAEGYSDLTIDYIQGRPIRLTASIDDGGSNTISKHQGTLALAYDNLWELGDLFHFSLTRDLAGGKAGSKSHTLSVHYSLPWRKWLASVDHTRGGYRQSVSGAHQKYLYQGNSRQTWLKINRLAWRSASHKLSVYAQAFLRESRNYIDDTEIEVQRRRTAGWEAGIQHRAYIGSATADTSIMFRRGTGAFGAISAPEQGFGEGTARFKAISIDAYLQWLWGLGEHRLSQSMSLRAQWNRTPLTPDERLSLGGRHSIRGFNGDRALIADRGWVLRNELALLLSGKQLQFYSGLDIGSVGGASRQKLPGRKLAGAALGLRGKHKHTSYDFFASVPLHKPRDMQAPRLATGFSLSHQF
jgi:hemolysin activation/secretion protein